VIKREMSAVTGDALERRIAQALARHLVPARSPPSRTTNDSPVRWRRVPVTEGIELHVRDDSPAARDEALTAMREAVRAALARGRQ